MKLLFGCGYLGSRVARLWRDRGEAVTIVTRKPTKAAELSAEGYRAIVADVCDHATLVDLPPAETVLFAVGYERGAAATAASAKPIEEVYAGGLSNVLNKLRSNLPAHSPLPIPHSAFTSPLVIYISSTGVYADAEGDWVDEETPARPIREGGRACLAAEQVLAGHPLGVRSIVLRPAGIYGPQRIPRAETLRRGEPIDAPPDGFLNLIHVDDLARIVCDVERLAHGGEIALPRTFNVADGHPVVRREYYRELARLLDAPPPRFVESKQVCQAVLRAAADKRIATSRLTSEVAPNFAYPSFREGLAAIVASYK